MSNVDINVDRRTDGRKIGRLYRTLLQAGAIKTYQYFWAAKITLSGTNVNIFYCLLVFQKQKKQEAHGPQLAHLNDITTADMQMLCNIFPILSSQPMKRSLFEQFLVLKKNIWA